MNNCLITSTASTILNDRTRLLVNPVLRSYGVSQEYDQFNLSGLGSIRKTYDAKLINLGDRLVFIFYLNEIDFTVNFQSFTLGFKDDISRSNSGDVSTLFYFNADNVYGGIVDQSSEEDITTERLKVSQLKLGTNSIILPITNQFKCRFIPTTILDSDLNFDISTAFKQSFSYYENI